MRIMFSFVLGFVLGMFLTDYIYLDAIQQFDSEYSCEWRPN